MIDAEILQHCMQIIKGDEWNSTEKTKVGLGLIGPLPLDEPLEGEGAQTGSDESEEEEWQSTGKNEQDDIEGVDVKLEDQDTSIDADHWGCPCRRPYKRTEVIYCDGQV